MFFLSPRINTHYFIRMLSASLLSRDFRMMEMFGSIRTAQFIEYSSSRTRSTTSLQNIKWQNSHYKCGTRFGVRSGKPYHVKAGEMIIMPAHEPHALKAIKRFKMLLIMIRV